MRDYRSLMAQIRTSPQLQEIVNPDGLHMSYRLDQLEEKFREAQYDVLAIENNAYRGQYRRDMTDEEIYENIKQSGRFDANEGLIFARQLEEIDPTRYEFIHKPLTKWKEVLPVRTFTPGTDRITYRMFDHSGQAELNSPGNVTEMPMADAEGQEFSNKVYSWKLGYYYAAQELRRAAFAGVPLPSEKIRAVEFGYQRRLQTTMFTGYSALGLEGLINHTGVTNTQAAAPVSGTDRTWPGGDKTNDEIAKDVTDAVSRIRTRTYSMFGTSGMVVALNEARYNFLANTRMASGTDTTIMQYILSNRESNGIEKFVIIHDLTDQGTSTSQLMIVYPMDNMVLEANVAENILWMPMETKGLAFIFNSEMEFGGVTVRYAVAMEQVYGI
jgi:hypothetical protein